jgi:rhamnose utilization protein RhaD (predicted bifunctional aldolase and dehydrogenase)
MPTQPERVHDLLRLSHELADPRHPLAILGEGNTSARLGEDSFLVKASGSSLGALREQDVVECRLSALLPLLDQSGLSDADVDAALMASRANPEAKKPSVEALFHAWLLTLPGVEFIGHTHPPQVNSLLCSPRSREFAERRIFPDEIVCCDVASVFIPFTDPGLRLAQAIREQTRAFMEKLGRPPRVIVMQNHGLIALGRTADAVLAASLMAEKAAGVWLGAAALGGPVFLTAGQVERITGRPDEQMRRKIMKL